uniref:Uncharacterized protein n=1 Tax=Parastrongyloides trichosuri TaxID=131310 RepID=A0A0N4Z704_PARTI
MTKPASTRRRSSERCGNPTLVGGTCAINVDFEDSIRNVFPFTNRFGSKQIQWLGFLSFPESNPSTQKKVVITGTKTLQHNPQLQINWKRKGESDYEYIPTNFVGYFDMQRLQLSKADFSKNKFFGLNGPPFRKNYTITIGEGGKSKIEYIKLDVILRFTADGKYQMPDKKVSGNSTTKMLLATKDFERVPEINQNDDVEDSKKTTDSKKNSENSNISKNASAVQIVNDPANISRIEEEENKVLQFNAKSGLPTVLSCPALKDVMLEINDDTNPIINDDHLPDKSIFKHICEEYKKKYIVLGYKNSPMLEKLNFQRLDKNLLILVPGFGRSNYCHALMKPRTFGGGDSKRRRRNKIERISNKRKNKSPTAPG